MKPTQIVLTINLTLFAVIGLFLVFIMNRPEIIPLFTGFQSMFNLLGLAGFYVDKKRDIMMAFVWGFLLTAVVTVIGFFVMMAFRSEVGVEEMYTL